MDEETWYLEILHCSPPCPRLIPALVSSVSTTTSQPNGLPVPEWWKILISLKMMFIPFTNQIISAAAAGLITHWGYFVHGERDLQAANIARVHILAAVVLPYLKCQLEDLSAREAIRESFILDTAYAVALFTSIIFYRIFLSPLRNVPGPFAMRISKLVHVWTNMDLTLPNCKMLNDLRAEYGDVVRTG